MKKFLSFILAVSCIAGTSLFANCEHKEPRPIDCPAHEKTCDQVNCEAKECQWVQGCDGQFFCDCSAKEACLAQGCQWVQGCDGQFFCDCSAKCDAQGCTPVQTCGGAVYCDCSAKEACEAQGGQWVQGCDGWVCAQG